MLEYNENELNYDFEILNDLFGVNDNVSRETYNDMFTTENENDY